VAVADQTGKLTARTGQEFPKTSNTAIFSARWGLRYYSGELGRWVSRDPIYEGGGLNLYVVLKNAPDGDVDPIGLIGLIGNCPKEDDRFSQVSLENACETAASNITDENLRDCVKSHCLPDRTAVRCGDCNECRGRLGFNPRGGRTAGFIVICPKQIQRTPFTTGQVLAHELAHECGWDHTDDDAGVPDWPRTPGGPPRSCCPTGGC
jgi:RHS repeat-associated protein